ncbi:SDR family oxidoreductase [Roseiconus nitratireducens]|uniref:SDR family oxidoreductase n=1 Tax=Roseiconus nitratireducens TaxID=2605748 RepID=A0A5M6CUU9_9BACT|nr:NAD(P)-binding oxidoreductase [Roseiconus nitratireducens]KAA5538971.1 SDR family oxidoreductase [Roseiconus nitratireducens]
MNDRTTVLVLGATGATGMLLVRQLLDRGLAVKALVRSRDKLPEALQQQDRLTMIQDSVLDLSEKAFADLVDGCDAVASCLGHNLSLKGIFGHPRRLVTDAIRRTCQAVGEHHSGKPIKLLLMNTAGNSNRDLQEPVSIAQSCVIGLLRRLVPPHRDNEEAADFLRTNVGQNDTAIEWVVIRPDSLVDEDSVNPYQLHSSPTRSAIFNPGKTSRVNVAHFMTELITDDELWNAWRGRMPVIYNTPS